MNVHWADLADGKQHCRLFIAVLGLYCDEPPGHHCDMPSDADHLAVCGLAHHEFRPTHGVSLPPKSLLREPVIITLTAEDRKRPIPVKTPRGAA